MRRDRESGLSALPRTGRAFGGVVRGDWRVALGAAASAGVGLLRRPLASEIAAQTAQPLGTVKTRIRLAMEKLRQRLGSYATRCYEPDDRAIRKRTRCSQRPRWTCSRARISARCWPMPLECAQCARRLQEYRGAVAALALTLPSQPMKPVRQAGSGNGYSPARGTIHALARGGVAQIAGPDGLSPPAWRGCCWCTMASIARWRMGGWSPGCLASPWWRFGVYAMVQRGRVLALEDRLEERSE